MEEKIYGEKDWTEKAYGEKDWIGIRALFYKKLSLGSQQWPLKHDQTSSGFAGST